jgi:hypothetical protein
MITLHTLTRDDFDDWNPLWQAYLVFYESTLPDDVTATAFARMTDPAEPMGGFLARDAVGQAVGMVNWIDHPTPPIGRLAIAATSKTSTSAKRAVVLAQGGL